MGFVLTIAYIGLTIISPEQFGPQWAQYHLLEYVAALTFAASLPNVVKWPYLKSSVQTFLLLALFIAIALSQVANGWFGGVLVSWLKFLPSAAIFFFVVANATTLHKLKILTLVAAGSCMALLVEALCGYYGGYRDDMYVLHENLYSNDRVIGGILRLRGVGFLNDPNDFAQILLIALPLLFIAWQRRRLLQNSLFVLLPSCILLWGVYLTHSRGALVGLAVLMLMAVGESVGTTASAVLTGALVFGMMAIDFTGGRAISASEGADRLEAWASGLELFKSAPIFGVGFGNFADLNGITAHNSFVLCLAELGLVGSVIWVGLLVTTMMSLNGIIDLNAQRVKSSALAEPPQQEGMLVVSSGGYASSLGTGENAGFVAAGVLAGNDALHTPAEETVVPQYQAHNEWWPPAPTAAETNTDVNGESEIPESPEVPGQYIRVIRLALISFLATSWFLSRTYSSTFCLVLGLATAAIALEEGATTFRHSSRWVYFTLAIQPAAIFFVYLVVRLRY